MGPVRDTCPCWYWEVLTFRLSGGGGVVGYHTAVSLVLLEITNLFIPGFSLCLSFLIEILSHRSDIPVCWRESPLDILQLFSSSSNWKIAEKWRIVRCEMFILIWRLSGSSFSFLDVSHSLHKSSNSTSEYFFLHNGFLFKCCLIALIA